MGWYPAVGRPLFFALPPETAHRVAGAMLGLPLPWRRIGNAIEEPRLEADLAGIRLRNPIGLAAGFDKTCAHLDTLGDLGFGYVVGGTITRDPRTGNPGPRIVRYPARRSMTNAMGLPNPGADAAAANLAGQPPAAPRLISVADEALEDAIATAEQLAPFADGIELNASCPNVSWGRDRDNEAHLRALVTGIGARTEVPLFVKLPASVTDVERDVVMALTDVAQEAGADGLTCSNTRLVGDTRLSVGKGGLSGRALWDRTLATVAAVRNAVAHSMPVNACGGIWSGEDVLSCLEAGATTVQVYSALIYEGPGIVGTLTRRLARMLEERSTSVRALAGASEPAA